MEKNKKWLTYVCVIVGSLIMALNIKSFVSAGNLIPGGFAGLTIFIQKIFLTYFSISLPYSLVNYSLNIIPIVIGFKMIGKKFTFYSCLVVLLSGFFVDLLPEMPITYNPLLIAVFGGILNGFAISITLKGKASSGGTDFIAMFLSKRTNTPSWNYVLGFNVCMLILYGLMFGFEAALYSIIFQYASTQVINALHVTYKKVTLNIMTTKPDELATPLMAYTHHGITRFEGMGCYSNEKVTMLYTVISSEELKEVVHFIHDIDDKAFINIIKTSSILGRFYQSPIE